MSLSDLFIPNAYAQAGPSDGGFSTIFLMVAIIAIFYFLLIRPQQKRAKQHREMLANVKRGDNIITTGGLKAKVQKVTDDEMIIEAPGGVQLTLVRDGIATVIDKTVPAKPKAAKDAAASEEKPKGGLGGLFGGGKKSDDKK